MKEGRVHIVNDVSDIIKPARMTLLLGPPGCGKTTFLKALSGNLDKSLKVTGEVTYNGYKLGEFVPHKTSSYISQYDMHVPEMTVRETIDFSSECQGVGSRPEILAEVMRREKAAGIVPDAQIGSYMKAISVRGQKTTLQTDYILKILGLDICADTPIACISGGQKKRLTTGDLRSRDDGGTHKCFIHGRDLEWPGQLDHMAHITDATIVVSLLQPAPETFDLFDDVMLMAEGKIIYHGPKQDVVEFFTSCGYNCPESKGVISRKDQVQYWHKSQHPYSYVSIDVFAEKYKESIHGKRVAEELSVPFDKSMGHENAISFHTHSLSKWTLFKACMYREYLLVKKNLFVYLCKSIQLVIIAVVSMTLFVRTEMGVDPVHANSYMGALFYSLLVFIVNGIPYLSMMVAKVPVFYKQRNLYSFPAWAYAVPATIINIPFSLFSAVVWTSLTYYVIGYSPEAGRFFRCMILMFGVHISSISMFHLLASVFLSLVLSSMAGNSNLIDIAFFTNSMPDWLKWAFWLSPISYAEIGLSINEFLSPRWQNALSENTTVGRLTLQNRGLNFGRNLYWISVGALFGLAVLYNVGFTLALTFLKRKSFYSSVLCLRFSTHATAIGSRAIISKDRHSKEQGNKELENNSPKEEHNSDTSRRDGLVLPFEPLTMVFQDVQYYIETKNLQLLHDISGTFQPGVLIALMDISGAGKTTLLDVLSGRKTSGIVEGEVRVGGYPKVQNTFARISGYCEQNYIHSPEITVHESLIFSAWLRLDPQIDSNRKYEFVKQVLETIELEGIKDALVGTPGADGLSTEQRKRLTIVVKLVANPSIIFMDEPTTGLDARTASVVMRTVKNVANTGRTIVCTIHQPSIDVFETFDEGISGVPRIQANYNPATWMLEITSVSSEAKLGLDFADIYKNSSLHKVNKDLGQKLSIPPPGSKDLHFERPYAQNSWGQFKSCLWKQHFSYWRSPSYNLMRSLHMLFSSFLFGILFWNQGQKM
ncbi:ABC transporter G family member 37 [Striga asiatica]|uniref:ABC transporter G family member 37 n=1 Tax=Striga asiatica TaxID=4170 RepID=A0A5A7P4H2_STRAF|nr:ABC transporter G family member 37 [Striga asiatica]